MGALDPGAFDALTFDCYGTLIDWEAGIVVAARRLLAGAAARPDDDTLLEAFARHEADVEAGPYRSYREVLTEVARRLASDRSAAPSAEQLAAFAASVRDWPAFPDATDALRRLGARYRLAVVTNCDDDLFDSSFERLGIDFDVVVTAQQARAYKPATRGFELAFERLRLPRERILHVAQSLFHDHLPAQRLGLATAWVDRRRGRAGFGATPPADAAPDLAVPDLAALAHVLAGR
jgi:2-haloacid dehalogenase